MSTVHIHIHADGADKSQLDRIEAVLNQILNRENKTTMTLTELKEEVRQTVELEASAVGFIKGIAQQLKDALANNDTAAIAALAEQLQVERGELARAITDNTPAATV